MTRNKHFFVKDGNDDDREWLQLAACQTNQFICDAERDNDV